MSGLPPGFLAYVDQERAKTAEQVRALAAEFREHADTLHDGDPVCAHAHCAVRLLLTTASTVALCDIAAGAVSRIVALERELEELRAATGWERGQ